MSQAASRAARLIHMRDLLLERPRTTQELALLCDISMSTVCRDLVTLQMEPLRLPLVVEGGCWKVMRW